jgi:tetratricopeptide (TPR) repeat protein
MLGRILIIVAGLTLTASAVAETLVVYPFSSRDPFLGALVADRVAVAFEDEAEVFGPAVAPSLVPPLPVGEGFLNPTEFLQGSGVGNRVGSDLLRDALGADAVLTGEVDAEGDMLRARLYLATDQGVQAFVSSSPLDDPGRLAGGVIRAVATRLDLAMPATDIEFDLSGIDGELAQAVGLLAAGLVEDARRIVENIDQPDERASELLEALREVERGGTDADPALLATLAINRQPIDEPLALGYFQALAAVTELPAADLWVAVLQASVNDLAAAEETFATLPTDYPYGLAARATFEAGGGGDASALLQRSVESNDVAALIGVAAAAGASGDLELEKLALASLARVAPYFSYPFERLSFIAFDEGDALAAAEALAVAVELQPESSLYWTNLGWAYYLLGLLDQSESASRTALDFDPAQYVAQYNLGLVLAVTDRLEEAADAYRLALRTDPEVDDAAVADLEQALELYPEQENVHYALAMLYEAEGRRSEAATQYGMFIERSDAGPFVEVARERAEVLSAPPPPIALTNGLVSVKLGTRAVSRGPFHPADPLYPSFELYTPGDELPQSVNVALAVTDSAGTEILTLEREVEVPQGAIGFVVDDIELRLPAHLAAGAYRLDVSVDAGDGRSTAGSVMFEVQGEPQLLRQLLGRNLLMQALDTGVRLYGPDDLPRPELLTSVLLDELHSSADAAEEALPAVEAGRFGGMTGGELFRSSTAEDVTDFLEYLLASGAHDTSFIFAEAYAQWAIEGAPVEADAD